MLVYAPPKSNGGTTANIIRVHNRSTKSRPLVSTPPTPQVKSLAQLAAIPERPRSSESQIYIPDGCAHVAGDPALW